MKKAEKRTQGLLIKETRQNVFDPPANVVGSRFVLGGLVSRPDGARWEQNLEPVRIHLSRNWRIRCVDGKGAQTTIVSQAEKKG